MVLIIDQVKRNAVSISDMFYYMGIISKPATPFEALAEISSLYRVVLVSNPENFPDISDFMSKLTSYYSGIPIVSISNSSTRGAYHRLFDKNYSSETFSSNLATDIMRLQRERNLAQIGTYRLAGIDASCDLGKINVLNGTVGFTKTEAMILRYLIITYPNPQKAKDILNYSFKPGRHPELTSIRTHISLMNKKSREQRGKNIIVYVPGSGYTVSTPEINKSIRENLKTEVKAVQAV